MDPSSRRRQRHSGSSPFKYAVQQCSPRAVRSPSRRCRTGFCGACTGRPTDLRPPRQCPGQRPLSPGQHLSFRAGPSSSRHSRRHGAGDERRDSDAAPAHGPGRAGVGSHERGSGVGDLRQPRGNCGRRPGGLAMRAVPSGRAWGVGDLKAASVQGRLRGACGARHGPAKRQRL